MNLSVDTSWGCVIISGHRLKHMKTQQQLINNIQGQLNGISKMIEDEKDCLEVIVQMKAVRSAMGSLMNRFMEENFMKCVDSCGEKKGDDMMRKLLLELTKNN